jgi:hypothetical protein
VLRLAQVGVDPSFRTPFVKIVHFHAD